MGEELAGWCRRRLGAEPVAVLFRAGYLSEVTGLRLADGREVVVKARPPAPRLRGVGCGSCGGASSRSYTPAGTGVPGGGGRVA